ncbi:hypothetical protein TWF506_006399 [Arthrobotrys conoides]|uniref:Uncharacterized protein n=1 Tax=Arthrobotrys conoides TaxID=74498 RepID=A0AAN8NTJ0_9PEZI
MTPQLGAPNLTSTLIHFLLCTYTFMLPALAATISTSKPPNIVATKSPPSEEPSFSKAQPQPIGNMEGPELQKRDSGETSPELSSLDLDQFPVVSLELETFDLSDDWWVETNATDKNLAWPRDDPSQAWGGFSVLSTIVPRVSKFDNGTSLRREYSIPAIVPGLTYYTTRSKKNLGTGRCLFPSFGFPDVNIHGVTQEPSEQFQLAKGYVVLKPCPEEEENSFVRDEFTIVDDAIVMQLAEYANEAKYAGSIIAVDVTRFGAPNGPYDCSRSNDNDTEDDYANTLLVPYLFPKKSEDDKEIYPAVFWLREKKPTPYCLPKRVLGGL